MSNKHKSGHPHKHAERYHAELKIPVTSNELLVFNPKNEPETKAGKEKSKNCTNDPNDTKANAIKKWVISAWKSLNMPQGWTIAATIVMAIAMIFYTIYAGLQWGAIKSQVTEMIRQYPKLEESADAAKNSARIAGDAVAKAEEASHSDQRAWIYTAINGARIIGQPYVIDVKMKNSGKTPATHVNIETFADPKVKGLHPDFHRRDPNSISGMLPPNADFFSDLHPYGKKDQAGKWIDEPLDDVANNHLKHGDTVIYVYGRVNYCDVFSVPHWLTFCYRMSEDGKTASQCKEGYNQIDFETKPDFKQCPAN